MADIAMLVAEEYERRVKNSRKSGVEEIELFTGVSALAKRLDGSKWIKKKLGEYQGNTTTMLEEEMNRWVPVPKSQIGVAAINGLFSA